MSGRPLMPVSWPHSAFLTHYFADRIAPEFPRILPPGTMRGLNARLSLLAEDADARAAREAVEGGFCRRRLTLARRDRRFTGRAW